MAVGMSQSKVKGRNAWAQDFTSVSVVAFKLGLQGRAYSESRHTHTPNSFLFMQKDPCWLGGWAQSEEIVVYFLL
jgi:hypothetical protein